MGCRSVTLVPVSRASRAARSVSGPGGAQRWGRSPGAYWSRWVTGRSPSSSASSAARPMAGRFHQVKRQPVVLRAAVIRVRDLIVSGTARPGCRGCGSRPVPGRRTAAAGSRSVAVSPSGAILRRSDKLCRSIAITRSYRSNQEAVELPGAVTGTRHSPGPPARPGPPGPSGHRDASDRTRTVHFHRAGQASQREFLAQHNLGGRRPADVAQADEGNPIRAIGMARCRGPRRGGKVIGHGTRMPDAGRSLAPRGAAGAPMPPAGADGDRWSCPG